MSAGWSVGHLAPPTRSLLGHPAPEREGEAVVRVARSWIGTPYRHQASVKGVGADCLGLVRGIWREVVGREPQVVPPYSPDWAEVGGAETLLEAARVWLVEVQPAQARIGDVLLFRMNGGAPAKHCGVLSAVGPTRKMIHAYWGRAVVESWMGRFWEERLAGAFRWPSPLGGEPPGRPG